MCDYSLEMYGTRPAREGERYVTTRFRSGTIGLAVPGTQDTPICVQCDTRLRLEGIPADVQRRLRVGAIEEASFVRLDKGPWHDGVRFGNGAEASLQELSAGVGVVVTSLLGNVPHFWELIATR
ncbi:MAG: hypothetical protein M0002_14885 [Rhodospirillales bacterium]|nr:hypothetical protein [Rhodospirillales bacterium]